MAANPIAVWNWQNPTQKIGNFGMDNWLVVYQNPSEKWWSESQLGPMIIPNMMGTS